MASRPSCNACLRALRKQRQCRLTTISPSKHAFTNYPALFFAGQTSSQQATPSDPSQSAASSTAPKKIISTVTQRLGRAAPAVTDTYTSFAVTLEMYKECARQANYTIPQAGVKGQTVPKTVAGEDLGVGEGWWYGEANLTPTFSTWAQITILHFHLLITRLRHFPPETSLGWQRQLLDHFFHDAEHRMSTYHNMHARGVRNKYLKDLYVQYRGAIAAYDEGIARGDSVLATAVWRNVFAASGEVNLRHLAAVVCHMRRAMVELEKLSDEIVFRGNIEFGSPEADTESVDLKSRLMDEPFREDDSKVRGGEKGNGKDGH